MHVLCTIRINLRRYFAFKTRPYREDVAELEGGMQ